MPEQLPDIQSAALLAKEIEAARGTLLGLALGDAWHEVQAGRSPAAAGVGTQLACATVDGAIRALERAGQGLPPEWAHTTYDALRRWATRQDIPGMHPSRKCMTDGWLHHAPVLAQRRGNAPTTVAALMEGTDGLQAATRKSMGSHGLVRTLPLGLLPLHLGPSFLDQI